MSSGRCFIEPQAQRPRFQSHFGSKQSNNAPRRLFQDLTNINEVGYGNFQMPSQGRPQMPQQQQQQQQHQYQQQHQVFHFPSKNEEKYPPVEKMYPPDPPQEFQGYSFIPSNEISFDDDIEYIRLNTNNEINWF